MRKFAALAIALVILCLGVIEWVFAGFATPGPVAPHGSQTIVAHQERA